MKHLSEALERQVFDAGELMRDHPPVLQHGTRNKGLVMEIACGSGAPPSGEITYTRWHAAGLPPSVDARLAARLLNVRPAAFEYSAPADGWVEWHLNFADPILFGRYGSNLLAQDELQVAEHPVLGALSEALRAMGTPGRTVGPRREPTPVLVMGAERRVRISTGADAGEGRPYGIYGNAFASASMDVVRRATTVIDPPTRSNILAIAAPACGSGGYTTMTIQRVLETAYTGFRAAVAESRRASGAAVRTAIHTGFWGCGAFGGNRTLMTMLQGLAAAMAGVDRVDLHTVTAEGVGSAHEAVRLLSGELPEEVDAVIGRITGMGFRWGVSDGN